jgi:nucleoside-diphosphate-sugar epimerase
VRVVVTGAAGFVGSHLVESLVARGDDVLCVERAGANLQWISPLPVRHYLAGVENLAGLTRALHGAEVVYHLAALTEARRPDDLYAVNTEGTANVMRAAAAQGVDAPHVVFLSSISATGPCPDGSPATPDSVPHPISHYGRSKLMAEAVVHAWSDRVPTTVLRCPTIYGPRERAVLKFFRLVRSGVAITIGDWDRVVSMLYVKDLLPVLLAAGGNAGAKGRTYCVGHPEHVSWRAFCDAVGAALGRDPFRLAVPVPLARGLALAIEAGAAVARAAAILNRERVREMLPRAWVCDATRATNELGFAPVFPIARAVPETAAWYRQAGWL